jgi:hypothetical protein
VLKPLLSVLGCLVVVVASASAQQVSDPGGPGAATEPAATRQSRPRWSVAVGVGSASSGPAGSIEAVMRAGGFDDTLDAGGLFGAGEVAHPFSRTGFTLGLPAVVDVERRIHGTLGVAVE